MNEANALETRKATRGRAVSTGLIGVRSRPPFQTTKGSSMAFGSPPRKGSTPCWGFPRTTSSLWPSSTTLYGVASK